MRTLSITWCQSRMKYGSVSPCNISSFSDELDPEFVERKSLGQLESSEVSLESARSRFDAIRAMLARK